MIQPEVVGSRKDKTVKPLKWRAALLAVLAVMVIFVDSRTVALNELRSAIYFITKPLIEVAEIPAVVNLSFEFAFEDREKILHRNRLLVEKNAQLIRRINQLENSERTAKWLANLLNAREQLNVAVQLASLKSINLVPFSQRVVIGRGSNDGVYIGQAVLDHRGILGQVSEITATESAVTLITNSNHSIPVRVRRTGLLVFADGLGVSDQMSVQFVAGNRDIRIGDVLVTSGLGKRFPAGYPVAEVTSVVMDQNEPFVEIFAKPYATVDFGYDVLLVLNPEMDASAVISSN